MATTEAKSENPGDERAPEVNGANTSSERPPFAISEPMREDQVQNAVHFLSHPKVKGSPVIYRRSFLEKKGLTKEEIDEAFRRVPDPAADTAVGSATTNQVSQTKSATTMQPQAPNQTLHPVATPAGGLVAVSDVQKSKFQWLHAVYAIGIICGSGVGTALVFKNMIVPRMKAWIRKIVEENDEVNKEDKTKKTRSEEEVEAAKAVASAANVLANASQQLLNAKNEDRKYFDAFMEMMDTHSKEMKSMSKAIQKLEVKKDYSQHQDKLVGEYAPFERQNGLMNNPWRASIGEPADSSSLVLPKQAKQNGMPEIETGSVRQPSETKPTSLEYPKSYTEIINMIQRGEIPPGIKEINDMPPNPNQPPSKPLLAPRPKPWEIGQQTQQRPTYGLPLESSGEGPYSEGQENGLPIQLNNGKGHADPSEPFWKKSVKITELEPDGEPEEPRKFYGMGAGERSVNRGWVPPQPPAVMMPEAAAAIRHLKPSSAQKQQQPSEDAPPASVLLESGGDGVAGAAAAAGEAAVAEPQAPRVESEADEVAAADGVLV